jgi:hypothetical protein
MAQFIEEWDAANDNTVWMGATYVSTDPDMPHKVTIINDTTGVSDGRVQISGELQQHYGLQARVRSDEYSDGWVRANAIRTLLSEGIDQAEISFNDGTKFLVWCAAQIKDVMYIGRELPATNRKLFTLNFTITAVEITKGFPPP